MLHTSVEYLTGIGGYRAELLRKELHIFTYADLLQYYPFRYVDRSKFYAITDINDDKTYMQLRGRIGQPEVLGVGAKKRLVCTLYDDSGSLQLVWFAGIKWLKDGLKAGEQYVIFGKPNYFNGSYNMPHPEIELAAGFKEAELGFLQPVYNSTEKLKASGLDSRGIQKVIKNCFAKVQGKVPETLPAYMLEAHGLVPKATAVQSIHFPLGNEQLQQAIFRLKFEELFYIQFQLLAQKAKRNQTIEGYVFDKIGDLFNDFYANQLPFELTNAQKRTVKELRQDTRTGRQLNRLVQGDVGSGKTVVALLAMLLALDNGYQACLMAPTEILATQHLNTLTDLLKNMPVNIKLLTGSTKAAERRSIHSALADGSLHILIGTHALIEPVVQFKNLGLAVIDEQHRFGVEQRAALYAKNTLSPHILVMTATPIPRTLQFSLMGARDLSVMRTPPANRQPVHTELIAMTDERLRQIILDEVQRGGQVFFVHNRVMNINEIAEMIGKLCPNVTIGIAHGQMEGNKLEDSLLDFINGEFDVLVATNIIESGLDIPNANTIIINQAQNFGLSDLHQMRGRVGRSNVKAYCYLSVPPINSLSDDAQKRLQAIETFSDLGSGFNVALRDLDIRGAGNLLGGEQSGFITDIGFEMYQKILEEAILELKEDAEFTDLFADQPQRAFVKDCTIETDFEALFPDKYISNANERLNLYLELDNIETEAGLQRFETALKDRFGAPPAAALALIDIIRLRWVAKAMGFERLWLKNNTMKGYFVDGKNEKFYQSDVFGKVLAYIQANPKTTDFKQSGSKVILDIKNISSVDQAKTLLYTLLKPNE